MRPRASSESYKTDSEQKLILKIAQDAIESCWKNFDY